MTEWREATLGELINVKHGYAFKGEFFAQEGEAIVLTPGNFRVGGGLKFREGKERYYTGPFPPEFKLSQGELLVVMTDLKQDAPILGSPAFVPDNPPVLHNQRLGLVTAKPGVEVDSRFLFYLMASDHARSQLRATATGTTVRHTAPERIYQVRVRLPSVGTQRRIGSILCAVDDLIENNRQRAELLVQMVKAIYREWFVQFRYPGHEESTLTDSPFGPIPEGWEVSTCGDSLTVLGGGTPSKKEPTYWDGGTIPWYTPSDLTKRQSRYAVEPEMYITNEGLQRSSARLFPVGSVLMTSRATLGVLAIATTEAACNQGFIIIPPDERWPSSFIYEWLDAHAEALEMLGTGATFKEITKGAFKKVPFLIPTPETLNAFKDNVSSIEDEVRVIEAQCRNLALIRELLLPTLVSGQIDVSTLDLDAVVGSVT